MSLAYFSTSKRQGHARAPGALSRLLRAKGLSTFAARGEQVHGTEVAIVTKLGQEREWKGVDGFLTDQTDQPLAIFTADCVPVFVANEKAGVVGMLHAGWRGTRGRILSKAVRLLQKRWKAKVQDTEFWMGPSIGPCCFEVQWDVARFFPKSRQRKGDRWVVNLNKEIIEEGKRLGLRFAKGRNQADCTMHNSRYYSYRRDPRPERQVSVIVRKSQKS